MDDKEIARTLRERGETTDAERLFTAWHLDYDTDLSLDRAEMRAITERIEVLLAQRQLLAGDILAPDRNERLDDIAAELKVLTERGVLLDALISIVKATDR